MNTLSNKRVAILVEDGFEQSELTSPFTALKEAGAWAEIISPKSGEVRGWQHTDWGDSFDVARTLAEASASDYDALLLPGGVMNPDHLRRRPEAVAFVRAFFTANKPVAAICHGPQLLIEADVVRGRTLTSFPSIRIDLINAGALWKDQAAVDDHGLVTSRSPDDLDDFNRAMIAAIAAAGEHPDTKAARRGEAC